VVGTSIDNYTFVDTNVLVYAYGKDETDPRAQLSRRILASLWKTDRGVISTQVLQEFYAVITRKIKPPLPKKRAREVVASYGSWCSVNTDPVLIISASRLEEDHSLAFWDALIIEAALRAGATKLLSEDLQHGRRFGDLVIENPFHDASSAKDDQ
jgi:predicted nucleic acid-binding protein